MLNNASTLHPCQAFFRSYRPPNHSPDDSTSNFRGAEPFSCKAMPTVLYVFRLPKLPKQLSNTASIT